MTSAHDKFLGLLKDDILKLDLAELDFGIYRILNHRRREIEIFLDRELPLKIDAALAKLPGPAGEDEQGRIFHHLYTLFSRYFDDGDFVTRPRRGRNAAYSVPYNRPGRASLVGDEREPLRQERRTLRELRVARRPARDPHPGHAG